MSKIITFLLEKRVVVTAFLVTFITLFGLSKSSLAQNPDLQSSIIKEIESTLLFGKETQKEVDFYKKKKRKDSDIVIDRGETSIDEGSSDVKIKIKNRKNINLIIREKEKMAYNSSLVNQYEAAIQLYKDVLRVEPYNEYAKFSLAILYQKIGQLSQAKALYYEILKDDPANKDVVIGNILSIMIEESPKDAIYLLSRLVRQHPDSPYIAAQSALAYYKIKDYKHAIAMFKRAINLKPDRVDYKYNLAVAYDKNGEYRKAIESYSDVVKSYQSSGVALTSIDEIEDRIASIRSIL